MCDYSTELQKAKSKAENSNNLREEANICNQLGELLSRNGKKGLHSCKMLMTLKMCHSILFSLLQNKFCTPQYSGNTSRSSRLYFIISTIFLICVLCTSGDYEAAIREHQQELSLSEVLSDVIGRAVANRKIGECYAEMGNIESALKVSVLCGSASLVVSSFVHYNTL